MRICTEVSPTFTLTEPLLRGYCRIAKVTRDLMDTVQVSDWQRPSLGWYLLIVACILLVALFVLLVAS